MKNIQIFRSPAKTAKNIKLYVHVIQEAITD